VLVDADPAPLQLVEQIYESDQTFMLRGSELRSSLELFQTPVRLKTAMGDQLAAPTSPFEIYRHVVDQDEAGNPVKVTYTALGTDKSFVMDFTGEQPSDAGIIQMLESFRPAPDPRTP
jgi:hypothetical protein